MNFKMKFLLFLNKLFSIQWISILANFKGNAFQLVRSGVRGRRLRKRSAKRRRRQRRRKTAITPRQLKGSLRE